MAMLPFWMEDLTPEIKKRAEDELGETTEVKKEALRELRILINEAPDLYCFENDTFLLRFLRAKKYDVKRSFKTLVNYYDFKKRYSGIMTDKIHAILKCNNIFVHPNRMPDGSGILTIFVGRMNLENFTIVDHFNASMVCSEVSIEDEASQICGGHLIVDFKGITFKKLRQCSSPSHLAMIIRGLDSCWPFRVSSCHIVNEPFYYTLTYNIMWPMVSKKMKERVFFHGGNLSSLHKHFPVECLPQQLGGPLGTDIIASQTELIISKQIEIEKVKKYSFLSQQKPVKKLSSCGLEENPSFLQNHPVVPKVAI